MNALKTPLFEGCAGQVALTAAADRQTTGRAAVIILDGMALYLAGEHGTRETAERLYRLADYFACIDETKMAAPPPRGKP
jgi:hypothetical protein